ncbi:MAG TPA: tetratricopeptide repeat protein [Pseudonocardia sp.]
MPAGPRKAGGIRPGHQTRRTGSWTATTGPVRGHLGAGLVDVPPVPVTDPTSALLTDPRVPEDRRFCVRCGGPVGRGDGDRPGPVDGVCPGDGTPFSFRPAVEPGELVAGQYEVRGCLAHGGLGWIYLAVDHNVSDRWVVLKGLLNAGDTTAVAAAVAERRFLAEVDHPNIVKIHNFVQHAGADGVQVGYIVMEYVGGCSLARVLADRGRATGRGEALPVAQAIAYAIDGLAALGYLHSRGLIYCDFKPENVIQYDRQLKLIDLGAVIRMDDRRSAVYGTVGYQAPEAGSTGPSPCSDVHTVGRSLAELALGLTPTRSGRPEPLPTEHPVLDRHESFHRALLRATDPDPLRRFSCAEEMIEQLDGVLREVLAVEDGLARPATSARFGPPRAHVAAELLDTPEAIGRPAPARIAAALPVPLVDPSDPAAGLLATLVGAEPAAVRESVDTALEQGMEASPELRLRVLRTHLEAGDTAAAGEVLRELGDVLGADWRLYWYRGLTALLAAERKAPGPATPGPATPGPATPGPVTVSPATTGPAAAATPDRAALERAALAFDLVYAALPGERAPKLALAATAECAGRDADAEPYYALLDRLDPALVDGPFGMARVALRAGDREAAVTALDTVPRSSSHYVAAQLGVVTATLRGRRGTDVGERALRAAAARIERLDLDDATAHRVRAEVLTAALDLDGAASEEPLLGHPWRPRELRAGLERSLRGSARLTADTAERIRLVDRANSVRPLTWT